MRLIDGHRCSSTHFAVNASITESACMARMFEPASVHVATLHTFVLIKSNSPPHGIHDALWLFKDLLLHEVVIATYGGRGTVNDPCNRAVERRDDVIWEEADH